MRFLRNSTIKENDISTLRTTIVCVRVLLSLSVKEILLSVADYHHPKPGTFFDRYFSEDLAEL